jgi:hypothetical protein
MVEEQERAEEATESHCEDKFNPYPANVENMVSS